jgi:hypothetical protein
MSEILYDLVKTSGGGVFNSVDERSEEGLSL